MSLTCTMPFKALINSHMHSNITSVPGVSDCCLHLKCGCGENFNIIAYWLTGWHERSEDDENRFFGGGFSHANLCNCKLLCTGPCITWQGGKDLKKWLLYIWQTANECMTDKSAAGADPLNVSLLNLNDEALQFAGKPARARLIDILAVRRPNLCRWNALIMPMPAWERMTGMLMGKSKHIKGGAKWFYFSSMTLPPQKQMESGRQGRRD